MPTHLSDDFKLAIVKQVTNGASIYSLSKQFKISPRSIRRWVEKYQQTNSVSREKREVRRFRSIYGAPSETIIYIGDWEQYKHRKYKEPSIGKGIRNVFRKAGYHVLLVDEFRTSCKCYKCHGLCETFRKCPNPKPWKCEETTTRHGLLMCQTCSGLWNRDVNSSLNILRIVEDTLSGQGRPEYLRREKKQDGGATSATGGEKSPVKRGRKPKLSHTPKLSRGCEASTLEVQNPQLGAFLIFQRCIMGCSGSKATGTTQCIALQDIFLKLECDASGTYGCFVRNQGNTRAIANFINDNCDVLVNGTILTNEQKKQFLNQLGKVPAFKIYLPTEYATSSFEHEKTILEALTPEERIQHTIYTMPTTPTPIFACTIKIKKGEYPQRFRFTEKEEQIETPVDIIHIIFLTICEGDLLVESVTNIDFNKFLTDLVYQIANLHTKNIIHKDIKPENILWCNGTYKLIDFGLAQKWTDKEGAKGFTDYFTTYNYTSPFILDLITIMYKDNLQEDDVAHINELHNRKVTFMNKLNFITTQSTPKSVDIYDTARKSVPLTTDNTLLFYKLKTTWECNDWYALAATIVVLLNNDKFAKSSKTIQSIIGGLTYLADFSIRHKTPEKILAAFRVPSRSK